MRRYCVARLAHILAYYALLDFLVILNNLMKSLKVLNSLWNLPEIQAADQP